MSLRSSHLKYLECSECGARFSSDSVTTGSCCAGGILLARYDLQAARESNSKSELGKASGSLWRYAPFLPAAELRSVVSLGEGWTPLLRAPRLGARIGCPELYIKDEGQNPTGSFKDRGASVAITRYRELGVKTVVLNSSGNAGAAWGLYAARAGIRCVSIVPPDIQPVSLAQCILSGARTFIYEDWHDAGALVSRISARTGWLNAGTLNEPYRLEGKKTIGYELAEQFGWALPNAIFCPIGGGTGAIAIWKAFQELRDLGWIDSPLPRLFVTQYEGCAPIVRAFEMGAAECAPWERIDIPPGGLKSPKPAGGKQVLTLLRQTRGAAFSISAKASFEAVSEATMTEGIFLCPEAATTLVGVRVAIERGLISANERVVVINTGSGLKSVTSLPIAAPKAINSLEEFLPLGTQDSDGANIPFFGKGHLPIGDPI